VHPKFAGLIEPLEPKRRALLEMAAVRYAALPRDVPTRGIYLFSEGERHLYVGRTNGLRKRLAGHCRPSSNHFTASFAFRIAREETGNLKATYKPEGSRASLLADPVFAAVFEAAKRRVASCDLRFVAEDDPTRQALLEIYIATVLETPYNDFDNH
jgi:hypothetical protein